MAFHLPKKFSQVAQIIFFFTKKVRKELTRVKRFKEVAKIWKIFFFLFGWHKKNRDERQVEKILVS